MSHFFVHVLVNADVNETEVCPLVSDLLAPYDENRRVKPYTQGCSCVGSAARGWARHKATEEMGTLETLRTRFEQQYPRHASVNPWTGDKKEVREAQKIWKGEFLQPVTDLENKLFNAHAEKNSPDPTCETCDGTGTEKTTYNPDSKWDWWVIGGRWAGVIANVDPAENKENYENCFLCHGTGMRNDALGVSAREQDPSYTCNGCEGEGKSLRFPAQLVNEGNRLPLKIFLKTYNPEKDSPFAVITPDGEWIERGKMGWWACVSNEVDESEWHNTLARVYAKFPNAIVVGVDCHI